MKNTNELMQGSLKQIADQVSLNMQSYGNMVYQIYRNEQIIENMNVNSIDNMQRGSNVKIITLRPQITQFIINELPFLLLCPVGLVYGGMENKPFAMIVLALAGIISLALLYKYIYMRCIKYHVGAEQLICEHGVFNRTVDYIELYRVVDFYENQTLMQQLFGLKTVAVFSMDRNTPKVDLVGLKRNCDVVSVIRERVEYNKRNKGIYEITNH